jgi:DNA-binding response OmpR family regulator
MNPPALVIEDDPDLAEIFSHALQAAGYDVELLRDGMDARHRLRRAEPTLVVLDLHLPRVSGLDLLTQMRLDKRLKQVPVVVATADARLGESLTESVDFVLVKPISYTQLRELTARLKPKGEGSQS